MLTVIVGYISGNFFAPVRGFRLAPAAARLSR